MTEEQGDDTAPVESRGDAADEASTARPRPRRLWRLLLAAAGVLVLLAGLAGLWLVRQIDPAGAPGEAVTVEIPPGTSASRIAAILDERGVITSARVFRLYARATGAGEFQAGIYRRGELRRRMAMGDAVDALVQGPEIEYSKLTIPEGFWLADVAARVGELPGKSRDRFLEVANSGQIRSKYQPEGSTNLEGLLFPDTYYIAEDETEEDVLRRMVILFDKVADDLELAEKAAALGRSPYEVIVLASLIEEETKFADERPLVASVIHNRLAKGMLLQIDASIDYAHGRHLERVLDANLEIDSPFNTYRHTGLTPTPIAAPGQATLEAALEPAETDYLFYVKIDVEGHQAFAETNAEHERNIARARENGAR